jgi:hypothetical protein
MPKVIALGPGGVAQAPVRDDRFREVIGLVREFGLLNRPLLTPVIKSRDQADDIRRAMYRSARYFCSCGDVNCTRKHSNVNGGCPHGGQRLGVQAKLVKDGDGRYRVQMRLFDKKEAMREIIRRYGPDPEQWPYRPGRRKEQDNGHV